MKLNMSKPIVAVLIPALIGIIGCADNPMTSAGENAESGRSESNGEHAGNGDGEGHEGREGGEGGAGRLVASTGGDEGGGEHGSGTGGNEGGEGGGGEGNETSGHAEGPEGGGGDPSSPILALDESFDGVVNGLRVAMSYDPIRRSFSGIVENAMALTACFVQIELNLKQGTRTVVELGPAPVGDLTPGASATTELLVDDEPLAAGVAFDAWEIHPEVFDCNCPIPGEGSSEGGGEGGDAGQQLAPDERYDQTRNGARLIMSYSLSQDAFYGIVENTTNQTLTRVRVEIHLTDQSGAIIAELGPTTPTDLAPGKKLLIVLPAAGQTFAGWSPHVEVGSGEGGESGGGEGGGEHGGGTGGEGGGEHGSGAGGGEGGESHAGREGGSG